MWGTEKLNRRGVDNNINKANKRKSCLLFFCKSLYTHIAVVDRKSGPQLLIQINVCTPWKPFYDGSFYLKPLKGYHQFCAVTSDEARKKI